MFELTTKQQRRLKSLHIRLARLMNHIRAEEEKDEYYFYIGDFCKKVYLQNEISRIVCGLSK